MRKLAEGDFQLIDGIVARLVNAWRLARRADEQAGEEIGQRRMIVPVTDQAAQQVGAAQERRIERGQRAEYKMIAATGAGMAAVEHELLAGQA